MRTRSKIMMMILVTWILFLGSLCLIAILFLTPSILPINNHTAIHYFTIITILLSAIFSTITIGLLYFSERLQPIARPQSQNLTVLQNRLKELENTNVSLQNELNKQKLAEREYLIHKEKLVRIAHYDSLTSLPNRVFFNELLNKSISQAKRHDQILAVLLIDIDKFKSTVNDTYGKHIANLALKELSRRFVSILRSGDVVARLGGDEFIVLLNDISNPNFAGPVAEKLIQICKQPIIIENHTFSVQTSIGIAVFPNDGNSLEDLQRHADLALYKAKHAGGGTYQYYRQDMDTAAHEYIKLETALRKAIQDKEFVLYFQPQLNLKTGTIKAVEALIRWENPELGLLSPSKFIPFAEKTGLIMPIGEWLIHEVCRTGKTWKEAGFEPIPISVNVSAKQFYQQDVAKIIADSLKETQMDPTCLIVEVTETAMMENVDLMIKIMNDIKKMGVKISIDDYGTGYTSINALKKFPVSILKIDRSFIRGIPYNQNDTAIVSSIISLGHNLDMKVVAEGVESTEQIRYLAEHNCDLIQGYFLSRPVPEGKIVLQFTKKRKKEKQS